ncbi:MAG TPA: CoA pyrophosphatase [Pyrinomonadaceae bacterium]|nr:CoA pyrophosphatase [Pyrinomonadaceae bacterium]
MSKAEQQMTGKGELEAIVASLGARLARAEGEGAFAPELKQAAVALVLRANLGAAEMLIIKRAVDPRDHWSGHLALPGGRREPEDADLARTAARETWEEVGMDLAAGGRILGRLPTITPRSPLAPQFAVTPYVALAPVAYNVSLQQDAATLSLSSEVESAFWVPVSFLRRNGASEIVRLAVGDAEQQREWPAYATEHGLIWGLTERILTGFLKLLD